MQFVMNAVFWILALNTVIAFLEGFSSIDALGAVLLTAWTVWSFTGESRQWPQR
jgi:hypothetical protein